MIHANTSVQCVGDVCTLRPPLSTDSDTSLPLIAFYMNIIKVEAAGVVDENNHCIGFVTSGDVIDPVYKKKRGRDEPCVADIMRAPNMAVYLDDPIEQGLIMMNLHKVDWLPVIDFDTQKFSGLLCREDIANLSSNIIAYSQKKVLLNKA